jgi:hypothetical protein
MESSLASKVTPPQLRPRGDVLALRFLNMRLEATETAWLANWAKLAKLLSTVVQER